MEGVGAIGLLIPITLEPLVGERTHRRCASSDSGPILDPHVITVWQRTRQFAVLAGMATLPNQIWAYTQQASVCPCSSHQDQDTCTCANPWCLPCRHQCPIAYEIWENWCLSHHWWQTRFRPRFHKIQDRAWSGGRTWDKGRYVQPYCLDLGLGPQVPQALVPQEPPWDHYVDKCR